MTPKSHHRIFTYYAALDKIESQLTTRLGSNDHDILFSLGDIAFKDDPKEDSFTTVCNFYNLDADLLEADFGIFKIMKEDAKVMKEDAKVNFTKASEVYDFLCQDGFFS